MTDFTPRVILFSPNAFQHKSQEDFFKMLIETVSTIKNIDHDKNVKKCCDKVDMRKHKIENFNDASVKHFHNEIMNSWNDVQGVEFLIFKN